MAFKRLSVLFRVYMEVVIFILQRLTRVRNFRARTRPLAKDLERRIRVIAKINTAVIDVKVI